MRTERNKYVKEDTSKGILLAAVWIFAWQLSNFPIENFEKEFKDI